MNEPAQPTPSSERRPARRGRLVEGGRERSHNVFDRAMGAIEDLKLIPHQNRPTLKESTKLGIDRRAQRADPILEQAQAAFDRHMEGQIRETEDSFSSRGKKPHELFIERAIPALFLRQEKQRSFRWGGKKTDAYTYELQKVNDYWFKTDGFLTHAGALESKHALSGIRFDVTTGADALLQKIGRITHDIDKSYLGEIKFSNFREGTLQIQAKSQKNIPLVVMALGEKTLADLAERFVALQDAANRKDHISYDQIFEKLEYHPAQLMLLQQIVAQLGAYLERANRLPQKLLGQRDTLVAELARLTTDSSKDFAARDVRSGWVRDVRGLYEGSAEAERLNDIVRRLPFTSETRRVMVELKETTQAYRDSKMIIENFRWELRDWKELRQERLLAIAEVDPTILDYVPEDELHKRLMTIMGDRALLEEVSQLNKPDWNAYWKVSGERRAEARAASVADEPTTS